MVMGMMRGTRRLSLDQARFLGDFLGMTDFERKLAQAPMMFLDELVGDFRRRVPFNTVYIPAYVKRRANAPAPVKADWASEILAGRGGACTSNNPFLAEFLREAGFRAHLVSGFNAARSLKRDSFHAAICVLGVETADDIVHCDVGAFIPLMRATKVNPEGATGEFGDVSLRYTVLRTAEAEAFLSAKDKRFSASYDVKRMFAKEGEDGLAVVTRQNPMLSEAIPHLAAEESDVWFPFHVFPNFTQPFDIQLAIDWTNDPSTPPALKLPRGSAKGILISGFSAKDRRFVLFHGRRCLKFPSSETRDESHASPPDDSAPPEVRTASTDEELLQMVQEDFPQLVDYCRDAIEMTPMFERTVAEFIADGGELSMARIMRRREEEEQQQG